MKDRLRDLRSIVRQHRHDNLAGRPAVDPADQPLRGLEGFIGHAASAFDDAMTLAETITPLRALSGPAVAGPRPLQSYFRKGDGRVEGGRAFRRDLYGLAKLALAQKGLHDLRILEGDFAAVHDALERSGAELIAGLHAETAGSERLSLVARLSAALFLELVRRAPIKPAGPDMHVERGVTAGVLAAIAIASGLATLDMEGAPAPELMEIATLAVGARGDRILSALDGDGALGELTPLFESLLTHLN